MKKKPIYSIHDVRHKGITGNTPIDFFEGEFYTTKDVKELLKRRKK